MAEQQEEEEQLQRRDVDMSLGLSRLHRRDDGTQTALRLHLRVDEVLEEVLTISDAGLLALEANPTPPVLGLNMAKPQSLR